MRFVLWFYAALLCAAVLAEDLPLGEVVDLEKLNVGGVKAESSGVKFTGVVRDTQDSPDKPVVRNKTGERLSSSVANYPTHNTEYFLYCKPDCAPCLLLKQRLNEMKIKFLEVTPQDNEVDSFPTMFVLVDGKAVRKLVGSQKCLNYFLEK